jgi:ribonuclease E
MAISFLRKVHAAAAKGTVAEVCGALPLEVAYFLLNRKKRELVRIEADYEIAVTVKGKPSFLMNQLELEMIRREKPIPHETLPEEIVEAPAEANEPALPPEEMDEAAAPASEGTEIKKKKRRRKKKGKGEAEQPAVVEAADLADEYQGRETIPEDAREEAGSVAAEREEAGVVDELKPAEHKKKRRRRRRRGKGGTGEGEGTAEVVSALETAAGPQPAPEPEPEPQTETESEPQPELKAEPVKKPRKKQAPRKKKAPTDETEEIADKTGE